MTTNIRRGGGAPAAFEETPEPMRFGREGAGGVPARRTPAQPFSPAPTGADLADLINFRAERLAEIAGEYPATPPNRVGALLGCGQADVDRAATKARLRWDERAGEWRSMVDPVRTGTWRSALAREASATIKDLPRTSPAALVPTLGGVIPDALLDSGVSPEREILAAIESQTAWRWRGYLGSLSDGEWIEVA